MYAATSHIAIQNHINDCLLLEYTDTALSFPLVFPNNSNKSCICEDKITPHIVQLPGSQSQHCKKGLVVLTSEWLPWLQTN